ncbi:MAG: hypothetical protein EAZ99_01285 [Alphaproteobacteria bacterium]|nr:zinc-ribbon domain-containing protein [Alphaproteobacteria bacterium]TAD91984.1 MAG: hypothetical protein EAZ99_01285 [Alphaproteobacteria bacterium]
MIVTCPNCASRYLVDPQVLGADGRKVRCANCGHVWHQTPPPDMAKPVDLAPPVTEPRPLPEGSNLPAMPEEDAPRRRGTMIGWLVFLVVVFGTAAGLIVGRQQVVAAWPPAARLYGLIGLDDVSVAGAGLEIRDPESQRVDGVDSSVLVVQATIANISSRPRAVPEIRVVARNAQRQDLKVWTFSSGIPALLPSDRASFRRELADPPEGAAELAITFATE